MEGSRQLIWVGPPLFFLIGQLIWVGPPLFFLIAKKNRAHATRRAFAGGSTTGSCSGARSTFRAVHRITQSVRVGLVKRVVYSLRRGRECLPQPG
jgi:hypothetical protein